MSGEAKVGETVGGWAAIVTACGGVLVIIGRGVAWLFRQRRGRLSELEARIEQLAAAQVEHVRQIDCLVSVCVILIDDISRSNPASHAIGQAKQLMGTEFPDLLRRTFQVAPALTPDMMDRLRLLDEELNRRANR